MKKFILIVTLFLGIGLQSHAQDDDKKDGGRLQALKIAYITKKLNLSPEEAQKFWPIYNQYADEIRKAQIEIRKNKGTEIEIEERMLTIRKKFNGEFLKAISNEKVNGFFRAEKEFNGVVQREMMERRQQRIEQRNNRQRQN
jgi:hypothetical protein